MVAGLSAALATALCCALGAALAAALGMTRLRAAGLGSALATALQCTVAMLVITKLSTLFCYFYSSHSQSATILWQGSGPGIADLNPRLFTVRCLLVVAVWAEPLWHALGVVLWPTRSTWFATPGSAGWERACRTPSSNPNFGAQTLPALSALLSTAGRALPGRRVFGMVSAFLRTHPPTAVARRVCALCTPCAPPSRSGQRRMTRCTRVGALQTRPMSHASAPGMIHLLPWARAPTV